MAGKKINLTDQLKKYFGFDTFKGNQEAIIQNLLAGNDTFVLMPTGGGKSLCYQLPSLMMEGTGIVISPLIALMKNQVDAMRNFSEEDGIAHFINSSLNKGAIDQVKSDILSGKTKLLYVAPESLTKEENVEFLKTVKISFYAVDEAPVSYTHLDVYKRQASARFTRSRQNIARRVRSRNVSLLNMFNGNITLSNTVMESNNAALWKIIPISRRNAFFSFLPMARKFRLSYNNSPRSGVSSPTIHFISTVFPEPLCPMIRFVFPFSKVALISFNTCLLYTSRCV